MSIRKVSDLPGLSRENYEWSNQNFMSSLIELSYPADATAGNPRFKSRYIRIDEFGTVLAQNLSAQIA
jgi:hypothetical protein